MIRPLRHSTALRRVAFVVSLVFFLLVAGADLSEALLCAGENQGLSCLDLYGSRDSSEEKTCDHCMACCVSHGHLQSLAHDGDFVTRASRGTCFALGQHTLVIEPPIAEIFHPPIQPTC